MEISMELVWGFREARTFLWSMRSREEKSGKRFIISVRVRVTLNDRRQDRRSGVVPVSYRRIWCQLQPEGRMCMTVAQLAIHAGNISTASIRNQTPRGWSPLQWGSSEAEATAKELRPHLRIYRRKKTSSVNWCSKFATGNSFLLCTHLESYASLRNSQCSLFHPQAVSNRMAVVLYCPLKAGCMR